MNCFLQNTSIYLKVPIELFMNVRILWQGNLRLNLLSMFLVF